MRRLLALLVFLGAPAWATTYYLDCASSGGDFTLQAGSPCIDAGLNLGSAYSEQLVAGSTWPDSVETIDWHKTGGASDIGAYDYRKVIW